MDSDLHCPLCMSEYSNQNIPRVLTPCGHTFCPSCLDTLIIEQDSLQFYLKCPEDQIQLRLQSNNIDQFPKNIALVKLIEAKKLAPTFRQESPLQITNIPSKEDSRGNQSEQQIINEIISSQRLEEEESNIQRSEDNSEAPLKEEEFCFVHRKPLEIVCLVDLEKICSKCAIFGEHKGHEFKSIEQIEQQCNIFREDIVKIYSDKEAIEKRLENDENVREILSVLNHKCNKISKDVSDRFKKLKQAIKRSEETIMKNIQDTFSATEKRIKETIGIDSSLLKEYELWETESFGRLLKIQEGSFQEKLRILYGNSNESDMVLEKGESIVNRIKRKEDLLISQIETIIDTIHLNASDQIYGYLQNFVQIKVENISRIPNKNVYGNILEESLLESQASQNKIQASTTVKNIAFSTNSFAHNSFPFSQSVSSPKSSIKPDPKLFIQAFSYKQSIDDTATDRYEKPTKKKLKAIKVPQKIQKILQSLYSDTLETLDLTNAELGDAVILQICEFLKGSRVKTVKFIRNKLSDDGVLKMIGSFGGISTLNLSQNYLTEQTLVHLANSRQTLTNLRTVILSQNKIIERKHKEFIDRLKKMELNVST